MLQVVPFLGAGEAGCCSTSFEAAEDSNPGASPKDNAENLVIKVVLLSEPPEGRQLESADRWGKNSWSDPVPGHGNKYGINGLHELRAG